MFFRRHCKRTRFNLESDLGLTFHSFHSATYQTKTTKKNCTHVHTSTRKNKQAKLEKGPFPPKEKRPTRQNNHHQKTCTQHTKQLFQYCSLFFARGNPPHTPPRGHDPKKLSRPCPAFVKIVSSKHTRSSLLLFSTSRHENKYTISQSCGEKSQSRRARHHALASASCCGDSDSATPPASAPSSDSTVCFAGSGWRESDLLGCCSSRFDSSPVTAGRSVVLSKRSCARSASSSAARAVAWKT